MKFSHLLNLMKDAKCTPEEFGSLMGVSGMTLRRWFKKSWKDEIPEFYIPAIREACYKLIVSGKIDASSSSVASVLAQAPSYQHEAMARSLGLTNALTLPNIMDTQFIDLLTHVGLQPEKRTHIQESEKDFFTFKKISKIWSERITTLWHVIRSKKIPANDKVIAYGALFYLINPLDLIPDTIPYWGLTDDYIALGIAVAYYSKKYIEFKKRVLFHPEDDGLRF